MLIFLEISVNIKKLAKYYWLRQSRVLLHNSCWIILVSEICDHNCLCWSVCTGLGFVINVKLKSIRPREAVARWLEERNLRNSGIQKGRSQEFRKEGARSRREQISSVRSESGARPSSDPGEPARSLK
jgi:hypothetical protein